MYFLLLLTLLFDNFSLTLSLPHILFVIVDDFGHNDVGYHRTEDNSSSHEISTPTMDHLVATGVEFTRHYVHMMCTPSRASFQTGRLPIHVLTRLAGPCDKNGAIPRNMTGIAQQLKKAGYATHQVGKWDAGMVTPKHTPQGRGYDTSLNYFGHGNWMWTEIEWGGSENHRDAFPTDMPGEKRAGPTGVVDFWDTDKPASHLNGTAYEELLFRDRIQHILQNHPKDGTPLYLNYNSKVAHYPLQAPVEYQAKFSFIQEDNRRMYHAMVNFLDDQLLNITESFKEHGFWDNTLMILSSDNGGYVKNNNGGCNSTTGTNGLPNQDIGHGTGCFNGEAGANNWPLRGGKYSMFEGGIRVNAFASGGYLPDKVRGTKVEGIIHIADWYGTLCELGGVEPYDKDAKDSGLPPIDSVNVWPMVSGTNLTSPRTTILVNKQLLVHNQWKYVPHGTKMIESNRGGPVYPNVTSDKTNDWIDGYNYKCIQPNGCLWNVKEDISELRECSEQNPKVVQMMQEIMTREIKTIWSTSHKNAQECMTTAYQKYGGFYGPWEEIETNTEGSESTCEQNSECHLPCPYGLKNICRNKTKECECE